jgi:hypothetical protein
VKYRVIVPEAKIRRHLMPARPGKPSVWCGTLYQGNEFEGQDAFADYVQIQEPKRSGFVLKSWVVALVEEEPANVQ